MTVEHFAAVAAGQTLGESIYFIKFLRAHTHGIRNKAHVYMQKKKVQTHT